jgi:hypothetical protein
LLDAVGPPFSASETSCSSSCLSACEEAMSTQK